MLLQRFDKNGDGKLDGAEQAEARAVLSGVPNAQPLPPAQAAAAAKGPLFGLRPLLQKYFDRNGGNKVDAATLAEIHTVLFGNTTAAANPAGDLDGLRKDVISTFDKKGDGKLDDAERAAAKIFLQQELADLDKGDSTAVGGKNTIIPPHVSVPPPKAAAGSASGPSTSSGQAVPTGSGGTGR
jgi:hypothetical protein